MSLDSSHRPLQNEAPNSSAPPLLPELNPRPSSARKLLAWLLSLCLGLFLADAAVSILDDSVALGFNSHIFLVFRIIIGLLAVLMAVLVYFLMALTPAIPKSLFVPLGLFYLVLQLVGLPLAFLYFEKIQLMGWIFSAVQVGLGLWLLARAQGGLKCRWPLVPLTRLGQRRFTWRNLAGFFLANVFILLPVVLIYLFVCFAGLVSHYTEGFMTLHPGGFTVNAKKYVRADGKTIQLFPMSHIAEGNFYQEISETFPTNSLILMEGVTDEHQLLKHGINYKKMASALGLSEQHEKFAPTRGEIVPADIDVSQFTTNTLDLLNVVTLIHSRGLDATTLQTLMQFSFAPDLQHYLFDDLLKKRNRHLLEQIQSHLPETEHLVVPWGVAHMPEIAREIQKFGFNLEATKEYEVIRFHGIRHPLAEPKPSEKK
jgi:hypothetical protein